MARNPGNINRESTHDRGEALGIGKEEKALRKGLVNGSENLLNALWKWHALGGHLVMSRKFAHNGDQTTYRDDDREWFGMEAHHTHVELTALASDRLAFELRRAHPGIVAFLFRSQNERL